MKKEKGITLVSLVVTIIILIILAGVSINLTLGKNGIITIAKQAKENTEIAEIEEKTALNELYMQIEAEGGTLGDISYEAVAKLTEFKTAIANYIEEAGGIKPETTVDTATFGESIKGIVKEVTKDATATADNITEGKTAWVNGELITGNGTDNNSNYTNGIGEGLKSLYSSTPYTQSESDVGGGVTATDADHDRHTINGSKSYRFYLTSANGSNALLTSITATVELSTSTAYSEGHASASLSWTITDNNGNSWASGNSAGTIVFDPLNKKVGNIEYLDLNMTYYAMAYTDPGQPNSRGSATAKFSNIKGNYIVI